MADVAKEPAKKAAPKRKPRGGEDDAAFRRIIRRTARERIEALRKSYESGKQGFDILDALSQCARYDVPIPEWVALEFLKRYDSILNCRVGSWDEAFDRPYPKGQHLHKLRRDRMQRFNVWNRVRAAQARGIGVTKGLFESIARELGLNTTLVERLYYEAKAMLDTRAKRIPKKR